MQALRVNFSEVLKFVSVLMKSVNAAICLRSPPLCSVMRGVELTTLLGS